MITFDSFLYESVGCKVVKSEFDLGICLIIESAEPIEYISKIMGIPPSRSIKKGESRFVFTSKADNNIWMFRKRFKKPTGFSACLQQFFEEIPEFDSRISELMHWGTCALRISVVSVFGQIGLSLSPKDIGLLNQLEIPVEISVFSYGNCVNS